MADGPDGSPFFDCQSGEQPFQLAIAQPLDLSLIMRHCIWPFSKACTAGESRHRPSKGL
jgi:hypothetical protein